MIKPRLKTSKAWTDLPEDFKTQVINLFNSHFKNESKLGKFDIFGRIYKSEIVLRCSYLVKDSIRPIQFDLSTDYSTKEGIKPIEIFEKLVDCAASLFQSTFDDEDFGVPAIWTDIDLDGTKIFAKSESVNHELEDQANKILGKEFLEEELEIIFDDEGNLVNGDLESDEIEQIAETLNKKKH